MLMTLIAIFVVAVEMMVVVVLATLLLRLRSLVWEVLAFIRNGRSRCWRCLTLA